MGRGRGRARAEDGSGEGEVGGTPLGWARVLGGGGREAMPRKWGGGVSILTCSQRHCFLLRSECGTRVVKWALGWAAPASREHPSSSCKLRSASEDVAASKVNIELELSGVSDPT